MEQQIDFHELCEKYSFLLTEQKISERRDILLHELGCLSKNLEKLTTEKSDVICSKNSIVTKLAEMIVGFGLVKPFQESEDRDYGPEDFPFEAKNAEECFEYLNNLLLHYKDIDTSSKRKFLVQVLLLCATHNRIYFWSSEKSVNQSNEFLRNLLECSEYKTLNVLLPDDTFHPTIFKAILKWMRPSLMKDNWMMNPSSCHMFYWLLTHVKHPYLTDYLYDVLPPSFMFCNYYAIPQQVLGIQCFHHILDNVPPSLIKADGIEDAIYDALKKCIYSKEIEIVEVLYPCLIKLPMMNLEKADHMKWLQFDVILQQLLFHVDMESNPKLRLLFLKQTFLFIKATPCFKHLKKSLDVLLRNFIANSVAEEECRVFSLKVIKELIRSCWPRLAGSTVVPKMFYLLGQWGTTVVRRMEHHCVNIMHAILKAVYDVEHPSYTPEKTLSEEIITLCKDCLRLLKYSCPKTFRNLVNEYIQEDDSMPAVDLLKSIS